MKGHNFWRKYAVLVYIGAVFALSINSAVAETLSTEEKDIIEKFDLYEDYTFYGQVSTDNEIFNVTEEEWETLSSEDTEYYMVIKIDER